MASRSAVVLIVGCVFALAATGAHAQSSYELFQQALVKERSSGQLQEAIALYREIVAEHGADRELAARALLQMGRAYETLGSPQSLATYERVLREYADQSEMADEARARLAAVAPERSAGPDPAGVVARRVRAGDEGDVWGSPSPDGRFLSHVDWATGDLAVRDLATGGSRRLTNGSGAARSSRFSPDGKRIAYQWFNTRDLNYDLRVIAVDGGDPEVVYQNPQLAYVDVLDWAPDGKGLLILLSRRDLSNQIAFLTLADGTLRVLRTFDWRSPRIARISPDGRWIAYDLPPHGDDSEQRDVFLLATDATVETPLLQHPAMDVPFGWAPDGRHLVFGSDRTGSMGAWMVAVEEGRALGEPQLVKTDLLRSRPMGITRDGALFYGVQKGSRDVYLASVDFATGQTLAPPAREVELFVGSNFHPDFSPDGRALAYVSRRGPIGPGPGEDNTLVVRGSATGEERALTPELTRIARPRWSPDGGSILVRGVDGRGRWGLYLVSAETGESRALLRAEPGGRVGQHQWAPDGRMVYYRTQDGPRIMALDVGSGATRELYESPQGNVFWLTLSPDGRQLAFYQSSAQGPSLHVLPTAGGAPREVARFRGGGLMLLCWTPDGSALVYARTGPPGDLDARPVLWAVPALAGAGGEPRRLDLSDTLPPEALRGWVSDSQLRVHPDGRRVAFSAGQDRFEVWSLEDFLPEPVEGTGGGGR